VNGFMAHKKKKFDAVEMSRNLREKTGRRLFSMTQEERLAYLHCRWEQFKAKHHKLPAAR